MMKGIIYIRVSGPDQVNGTSLDFQEELARKYCAEQGIEILQLFREEGESAKTADRTELLRALEFCRRNKGKVDVCVFFKVDRFSRYTEDYFQLKSRLRSYGVRLRSVTEPIGESPAEKYMETMLAANAEFDNAIRKQRCTDGMIARINQGIWPFHAPLGYACAHHKKRGEKKSLPDNPDSKVFPIIQRGLKEFARDEIVSQTQLAVLLDSWGLAQLRGTRTTPQLVDRLLGQYLAYYAGLLINPWTKETRRGLHQPMISDEEYHRIRQRRHGKPGGTVVRRDRYNPDFPLRRTVRCGPCARGFTGCLSRGNGGTYGYYFCANRTCDRYGKGIRQELLHSDFTAFLESVTPRAYFFRVFEASVRHEWHDQHRAADAELANRQRKLNELMARRRRICEMREDGAYNKEEFQERIAAVDVDLSRMRSCESDTTVDALDIDAALGAAQEFCENVAQHWFELPGAIRPRFERLVLPDGIAYDRQQGFRTATLGLLFELNRQSEHGKSLEVNLKGISSNQIFDYLRELLAFAQTLAARETDQDELLAA